MSIGIVERINSQLANSYNVNDIVYRRLIADNQGNISDIISKPTDIDIGVTAGQIEYLRRLSLDLVDQLYLDKMEGVFLKWVLNEFFNSVQLEDEDNIEWVQRTIATVFQNKVSRASIIVALRPYSTRDPVIVNASQEAAYADFSYADVYKKKTFFEIIININTYQIAKLHTFSAIPPELQSIIYDMSNFSFSDTFDKTEFYSLNKVTNYINDNAVSMSLFPKETYDTDITYTDILKTPNALLVIAKNGTHQIKRSIDDGVNWIAIEAPEQNEWSALASAGNIVVAVAKSGVNCVMRSTDEGLTWSLIDPPDSNQWEDVGDGNGVFIAVASSGNKRIMRSTDFGITWTAIETSEDNHFTSVSYGKNGIWIATAKSGIHRIFRSQDNGLTWSPIATPEKNNLVSSCYTGQSFVVIGENGTNNIMYSFDEGISWTAIQSPIPHTFSNIAYCNGSIIGTAIDGFNRIIVSEDYGKTWKIVNSNIMDNLVSVNCLGDDKFFILSSNGVVYRVNHLQIQKIKDETINILPAIAHTDESSYFNIKITMFDTDTSDIYTILAILDKIIAAGISYSLEIQNT